MNNKDKKKQKEKGASVNVRLKKTEKNKLERLAKLKGITLSELIRERLFDRPRIEIIEVMVLATEIVNYVCSRYEVEDDEYLKRKVDEICAALS